MFKSLVATAAALVCVTGFQTPVKASSASHQVSHNVTVQNIIPFNENEYQFEYLFVGKRHFHTTFKRVNCSTGETFSWVGMNWRNSSNYLQFPADDNYHQMFHYVCNRYK